MSSAGEGGSNLADQSALSLHLGQLGIPIIAHERLSSIVTILMLRGIYRILIHVNYSFAILVT